MGGKGNYPENKIRKRIEKKIRKENRKEKENKIRKMKIIYITKKQKVWGAHLYPTY
jgi:hypothetical protein